MKTPEGGWISVVGNAVTNGTVGPDGLEDDRSTVFLLNDRGEEQWRHILGLHPLCYVQTRVMDVDEDGTLEVLALETRSPYNDGAARIIG